MLAGFAADSEFPFSDSTTTFTVDKEGTAASVPLRSQFLWLVFSESWFFWFFWRQTEVQAGQAHTVVLVLVLVLVLGTWSRVGPRQNHMNGALFWEVTAL